MFSNAPLPRDRAPSLVRTVFTYSGEVSGIPAGSAPSTLGKSWSISAEVDIPQGGAEGMLNTIGGRFGGYGLYLVKGKPVFTYVQLTTERFRWESPAALTPGKHTVVFDFKYDGPGFGKGGTGVLSVDGKEVARKTMPHTIPFLISFDELFDVGVDTRTGVDDNDYQVPFRFTGKLDKLTVKLVSMNAAEEKLLQRKGTRHEKQGTVKRSAADRMTQRMSAIGIRIGMEVAALLNDRGMPRGTRCSDFLSAAGTT